MHLKWKLLIFLFSFFFYYHKKYRFPAWLKSLTLFILQWGVDCAVFMEIRISMQQVVIQLMRTYMHPFHPVFKRHSSNCSVLWLSSWHQSASDGQETRSQISQYGRTLLITTRLQHVAECLKRGRKEHITENIHTAGDNLPMTNSTHAGLPEGVLSWKPDFVRKHTAVRLVIVTEWHHYETAIIFQTKKLLSTKGKKEIIIYYVPLPS